MKHLLYFIILFSIVTVGCNSDTVSNKETKPQANKKAPIPQKATNPKQIQKNIKPVVKQAPKATPKPAGLVSAPSSNGSYKAKNDGWFVSLDQALEQSKKTGKPIMANFTGSDWCGWCKRLDKSVFHQPGFEKWADDNVVLLELDFPKRFKLPDAVKQQNQGLKQAFQIRGYPTIWVFDIDRDATTNYKITALGKTGYTKTFQEFKTNVGKFIANRKANS